MIEFRRHFADADAVIVERMSIGAAELDTAETPEGRSEIRAHRFETMWSHSMPEGIAVEVHRRRINIRRCRDAFALMIALSRRLNQLNGLIDSKRLNDAGYDTRPFDRRYTGNSNYARIGGLNSDARRRVRRARTWRNRPRGGAAAVRRSESTILYHQRTRMTPVQECVYGSAYVSFDELSERSDYISVHVPINASTRGLNHRAALGRMKRGVYLVNVARPDIIDRNALIEALDEGRLGGFGLDVGYEEPGRPDEPLLKYKNVILTPAHRAWNAAERHEKDVDEMCFKMWRRLATQLS